MKLLLLGLMAMDPHSIHTVLAQCGALSTKCCQDDMLSVVSGSLMSTTM